MKHEPVRLKGVDGLWWEYVAEVTCTTCGHKSKLFFTSLRPHRTKLEFDDRIGMAPFPDCGHRNAFEGIPIKPYIRGK